MKLLMIYTTRFAYKPAQKALEDQQTIRFAFRSGDIYLPMHVNRLDRVINIVKLLDQNYLSFFRLRLK